MLKGFRSFILRGNVIDLAVAVIIGAAFVAITNSLVTDMINPFVAALVGKPDFSAIVWHVHLFHPLALERSRTRPPEPSRSAGF